MATLSNTPNKHLDWNYILLDDGKEVGGLKVVQEGNLTKIYNVRIKEEFIGQGFGVELMQKTIEVLKEKGASRLWLSVFKNNTVAVHIYKKVGFKVSHTRDDGRTFVMKMFL